MRKETVMNYYSESRKIKPQGWFRQQLEIQAKGLSGNLDKFWPDIKDSAWIGGDREGWERVPYWLDGFIPLAWLLEDDDMKSRADKYINVGIGGTTTKDWIYAYDKIVKPFGADRFVISVGENDVRAWGCDGDEVVARLGELFAMIHEDHPEAEIYYIYSLPAAVKYAEGRWLDGEYEALVNGEKALCESLDYVQGVDTFKVLVDANTGNVKTELFGANNDIHLNSAGYQVWSDYVYDEIFRTEEVKWTDWDECKFRSQAPTRYDQRGYASNKGLFINAVQYVDNIITTGDAWTEQTHLEMEIWQHNIGYGWGGTYFAVWPNDLGWTNNNANINEFRCNTTITDRGENFADGYRYMISYEIYLGFENNVGSADGPYAYVQIKNHMPGETHDGFEYSYAEHRDGNRYLYQDNCNSYEFRATGIVGMDEKYAQVETDYNKELFYKNQGTVQAADPSVITVGDTFYLYGTNASEGLDCSYIRVWSSKNLTDWFEVGYAFKTTSSAWATGNLWAPEVIEHNGKYYMYYSGWDGAKEQMGIGVAVSSSPTGPFREIGKVDLAFPAIDPNPFIDDDGSIYLYVSKDQVDSVSSVYGCKLNADMVTVEYVTEEALVAPKNTSGVATGTKYWNEAPHMYKRDGKYYMTFSSGYYESKSYCLGLAISDEPLSGFSRVSYNPILIARTEWSHVSGTGHCSFFPSPDGKELWVAYHSHVDVENGGYIRQICFDKVNFDSEGRMVISGPSTTPQALPSGVSKYKNIAPKAMLSATQGGNTNLLVDGIVNYLVARATRYEYAFADENTLTFSFDRMYKVKGIMIYGGADGAFNGENVVVTVGENTYNMTLEPNSIPGTASILEIDETEANNVTITFAQGVSLSEIVILGEGKETSIESFPDLADFSTINSDLQSVDPSLYNFQMWTRDNGLYAYFVQKVPTAKFDSENNWENTHVEMEIWQGDFGYGWGGTYIGLFADESIYINNEENLRNKTLDVNITKDAYGETVIEYYFYLEFDNNLANPQDGPYAYVKQYQHLPGINTSGLHSQVIERDGRTLITGTENSFQVYASIDAKMNE